MLMFDCLETVSPSLATLHAIYYKTEVLLKLCITACKIRSHDNTSSELGLVLDLISLLTPLQKLLLAPGGLHMLNTHVNPFWDDPTIYLHGIVLSTS